MVFARLHVLLPFTAIVRPDDEFSLIDAEKGGFTFTILPPYKARLMPADLHFAYGIPMLERPDRLTPMPAPSTPVHLDDRPAILADALAVDIRGEGLTRASGVQVEPALPVAFDVVNDFLERLRVISEGHHIQPISLEMGTIWLLVYLNDDGTPFELDPSGRLVRARASSNIHVPSMTTLAPDLWIATFELPDNFRAQPWEVLLLDARRLLPDIGPSPVLAAAAVEVRLHTALDALAAVRGGATAEMWTYLSDREHYRTELSVSDQASTLFKALGGDSLKEDSGLWGAFRNLRNARNKYLHEGVAHIGGKPVDWDKAIALLSAAREIIDWIEERLPETERRPRYAGVHRMTAQLAVTAHEAAQGGTAGGGSAEGNPPHPPPP